MKRLRNFYFITAASALVFALLTRHIPGITVTDFVQGFCYGLTFTMLLAGCVTALIPAFYKGPKKDEAAGAETGPETPDVPAKP